MSTAPFVPLGPPPLPPGWSQHIGPNGQPYYHNAITQESTYVRPLPAFPLYPNGQPITPVVAATPQNKEKPLLKTPIPGTNWLRVKTTAGNVFYTQKGTKQSVWTVPDELQDAVAALEKEEQASEARARQAKADAARQAEEARAIEVERVKSEVKEAKEAAGKRKAEAVPVDEVIVSKKARVDDDDEEEEEDGDESDDDDESEEEEWQKEAAAQLAAEAEDELKRQEEERRRLEEEEARLKAEAEAQKDKPLNMPQRVDLSLDEAKALFKTLLREKNVNPLHPWDTSLPLFISDHRYVLLPSVSARKEAFDEYCRERARELRQSQVKKEKAALSPKEEFDRLLRDEVTSTRASWTEWRRQWKKDRRFYGWGKDDREREKRFRDYLKELGEKKRAAAQLAESGFFALLKESGIAKPGAVWKDVKKAIVHDPRYDAVGSSSLREELFNTYLKANEAWATTVTIDEQTTTDTARDTAEQDDAVDDVERERRREERKQRAVKEREEKIRAERQKVNAEIDRSKSTLNREESEMEFRTMLTDAIRDPQVTWDAVLPQLKTDPRFTRSMLSLNQQLHLFHSHVNQLRSKHLTSLHALFESHAPSLSTPFTALPVSSLLTSLPVTKLGYDVRGLEDEFEKWQRQRSQDSRRAFDEMLSENAFVEFWGRLGKIGGKGVDQEIRADDIGEDAEELVDMKALAKTVDLKEMVKVLRNDKRYLMFDHVPEQRERWLRDYLSQLSAPKLSVHVPESS